MFIQKEEERKGEQASNKQPCFHKLRKKAIDEEERREKKRKKETRKKRDRAEQGKQAHRQAKRVKVCVFVYVCVRGCLCPPPLSERSTINHVYTYVRLE